MINLEQRMYCLVPYNLSPIQQGIQAAHAIVEYSLVVDEQWNAWSKRDKTIIILNGGTTNSMQGSGTLNKHMLWLLGNDIDYASFNEPDLNNALTAVCFILDERVWDTKKYPISDEILDNLDSINEYQSNFVRNQIKAISPLNIKIRSWLRQFKLA